MKPVFLSLAGLQSYREKQIIDFSKLCEAGVFGIFGPTGSGKSTILDAMTLALYGKVERAANGTQGIMNHAENALSVTFAFELTDGDGVRKYRVERQFKRGNDQSVNNTLSRILDESSGETIVLADKVAEVNQLVQNILGLTMQDFTRAVVLPQGKFADFLSLKGSERRQMLQRLFRLERYGDVLNGRVSHRIKEEDLRIKQIVAEQQGLGDASEEALQAAALRLSEAELAAQQKRALRKQAEVHWEHMNKQHGLQQEMSTLAEQLTAMSREESLIADKEKALQKADKANGLAPYLKQLEEAALKKEQQVQLHKQVQSDYEKAQQALERVAETYAEAKKQLSEGETPLRIRLEQLQEARQWEAEWKQKKAELEELSQHTQEAESQLNLAAEQLQKARNTLAKALQRQKELKERQEQVGVTAEERNRLQEAERARDREAMLRIQADDSRKEAEAAHQQLRQAETGAEEAKQRKKETETLLGQAWLEGLKHRSELYRLELGWQHWLDAASARFQQMREQEKKQEQERLAYHLAVMLKEGDACPVCGSAHHPAIAELTGDTETGQPAADLHKLEELTGNGKEQQLELRQRKQMYQHAAESLDQLTGNEAQQEAAAAGLMDQAETIGQGTPVSLTFEQLFQEFDELTSKGHELFRLLTEWTAAVKQLTSRYTRVELQWRELLVKLEGLQSQHRSCLQRQQKTSLALTEQEALWADTFAGLDRLQLDSLLKEFKDKEMEAEDIRLRLDKSVAFIEELQQQVQDLQQQAVDREKRLLQLQTEHKSLLQITESLFARLRERVGEEPVERQIETAKNQLEQWVRQEKEAAGSLERAQKEAQDLDRRLVYAEQQGDSARQQLAACEQSWMEALEKSPFLNEDEVRQSLMSEEQYHAWTLESQTFREDTARLQGRIEDLEKRLGGERITAEQWEQSKARLEEALEEDELALSEKAKADRDLEDLSRRHKQWMELDSKRQQSQQQLTRLLKLQSVFRGNAFVEFIAEEQLVQVSRAASQRLNELTRQRYSIELDSAGGFVIRDDANGGIRRPVGSLSGGETFLTSLALALALSAQIQLNGRYPLEFFFLDEGFGTLDPELLDTVVGALEKLHIDKLTVGIISHVPELKARLPRRLIVRQAEPAGQGSSLYLESL